MLEEVVLADDVAVEHLLRVPNPAVDVAPAELRAEQDALREAKTKLETILDAAPEVRERYGLVAEPLRELIRRR